jgi:hypothetical protein
MIIRAPGKHGRYFQIVNVYQNTILAASIFSKAAISKLNLENASTYSEDYFSFKSGEESGLEKALFEFSNKIGAFITYVLIQAMNPRNEDIIRSEEKDLDRDALVQEWTKNAILTIVPFLLGAFKDAIFLDLDSIKPSDLFPTSIKYCIALNVTRLNFLDQSNNILSWSYFCFFNISISCITFTSWSDSVAIASSFSCLLSTVSSYAS